MPAPMTTTPADAGHPRRWWILAVMCLSLVLVVLDNTVTNVAIPTLATELDATGEELAWIIDSYTLTFGALLLTMGALGDRFGRRRALVIGLAVVGAAGLCALLAESAASLILVRIVMGIGAALVMPSTLSILVEVFPPAERAKAIAAWAGVAGAGAAIGLLLGGWLLENFAWHWVFTINAPIAVFAIGAVALVVPESTDPAKPRVDKLGTLLSTVTLAALLYAIIQSPAHGVTDARIVSAAALALLAGAAFALHETRTRDPMLPLGLFRDRAFSAGALAVSLAFFVMFAMFFVLSQYMQFVRGHAPLETGIRFLPLVLGMGLTASQSDRLVRAFGPANVIATGLLATAGALLSFSRLAADTPYVFVAAIFVLTGLGMGLIMPPATALVMSGVPRSKAGIASAVNDTTREVGGALGIGILGALLTAGYRANLAMPEGVPSQLRDFSEDSLGVALEVARRMGGDAGAALADAAKDAFMLSLERTYTIAAVIAFAAAILSWFLVPRGSDAAARATAAEGALAAPATKRPMGRAATAALLVLVLGAVAAGGALATSFALAPDEPARVWPAPPVVVSHEVGGRLLQANTPGLTTPSDEPATYPSNVTEGRAWAQLFWEPSPTGTATLRVALQTLDGEDWRTLAEAEGGPGLEILSDVGPLGAKMRILVAAPGPGVVDQGWGGVLLVATPEVPLPPPRA